MKNRFFLCLVILSFFVLNLNSEEKSHLNRKKRKLNKVQIEKILVKNENKEIFGLLYKSQSEEKLPLIIFSHGYNGSNSDFTEECNYFAKNGFNAFAYDFSGGSTRSLSKGSSLDMTIFSEKEDLSLVLEYFKKEDFVDEKNIFLFGASQGGLVTSLVAEENENNINSMILYYPAYNIPDDWRRNYPDLENVPESFNFWGLDLSYNFVKSIRDFYTFDNIGKFGKNILIIYGDNDMIVPESYIREAQKKYPSVQLEILSGEGHGFSPQASMYSMKLIFDFLKKNKL